MPHSTWRPSIALSADFRVEAPAGHGGPEFLNTDQGSQFTGADFVKVPKDAEVAISKGGKGASRDNAFVERLWRTVKYEEVCLRAHAGASEARASIGRDLSFYNGTRLHSSPGGWTPNQTYLDRLIPTPAAA